MGWSWKDSPELIKRLERAQNAAPLLNVDVMTIAGTFTSEDQLRAHIEECGRRAKPDMAK